MKLDVTNISNCSTHILPQTLDVDRRVRHSDGRQLLLRLFCGFEELQHGLRFLTRILSSTQQHQYTSVYVHLDGINAHKYNHIPRSLTTKIVGTSSHSVFPVLLKLSSSETPQHCSYSPRWNKRKQLFTVELINKLIRHFWTPHMSGFTYELLSSSEILALAAIRRHRVHTAETKTVHTILFADGTKSQRHLGFHTLAKILISRQRHPAKSAPRRPPQKTTLKYRVFMWG